MIALESLHDDYAFWTPPVAGNRSNILDILSPKNNHTPSGPPYMQLDSRFVCFGLRCVQILDDDDDDWCLRALRLRRLYRALLLMLSSC